MTSVKLNSSPSDRNDFSTSHARSTVWDSLRSPRRGDTVEIDPFISGSDFFQRFDSAMGTPNEKVFVFYIPFFGIRKVPMRNSSSPRRERRYCPQRACSSRFVPAVKFRITESRC
jgi:hypothetical protein